ncbi:MAG: hypothetical protein BWY64_03972 [bacterium ADurb.Bin363]|nr:MAG: hypothetical protein BWY64_03972 [bacterium ADurb.Bin363]
MPAIKPKPVPLNSPAFRLKQVTTIRLRSGMTPHKGHLGRKVVCIILHKTRTERLINKNIISDSSPGIFYKRIFGFYN